MASALASPGRFAAGALTPADEATIRSTLATASPDTVVHNPFTGHEGPLRLAVLDLTVSLG